MPSRTGTLLLASTVAVSALAGHVAAWATDGLAASQSGSIAETIVVHDNRVAAGSLSDGTLTVGLEARRGQWEPDGAGHRALTVNAFAADGGPLRVPGPLIRVRQGTTIRVRLRNGLPDEPLVVHGLYTRPATVDAPPAVVVPAGEARDVSFSAGKAGTYFYWGATGPDVALDQRRPVDTQLSGAIVVDPPGTSMPTDRVLVIGNWNNGAPLGAPERRFRFVINGRSWPATERLTYAVGDTVRMRLLNLGAAVHPMHLHGFYFNVDSRGGESADTVYPAGDPPRLVVTERLVPGTTFSLTWKPTRPGNWLFHCHDNVHLDHGGALDGDPPPATVGAHHDTNHTLEMMAGPVMGIAVTGTSTDAPEPSHERRRLRLTARVDTGGTPDEPAFGYTLDAEASTTRLAPPYLPGPTILLKRGEPVSITVANQLPEPTTVHWHGIELESYFDGVAGFAGQGTALAPAISPGGTFEARFTPPRSGTFIYHTHLDDTRQQQAGLSGPLLVVDDPAAYDPDRDLVFLVTVPRRGADAGRVLINGSLAPPTKEFRVGRRYRLRFINVHTARPSMRMRLLQGHDGDAPFEWRAVAKDGMDLPTAYQTPQPSEVQMGNGETYDFEFVAKMPGDGRLDVTAGNGTLLARMPVRVVGDRP